MVPLLEIRRKTKTSQTERKIDNKKRYDEKSKNSKAQQVA